MATSFHSLEGCSQLLLLQSVSCVGTLAMKAGSIACKWVDLSGLGQIDDNCTNTDGVMF
jgi:hypothetical protein